MDKPGQRFLCPCLALSVWFVQVLVLGNQTGLENFWSVRLWEACDKRQQAQVKRWKILIRYKGTK